MGRDILGTRSRILSKFFSSIDHISVFHNGEANPTPSTIIYDADAENKPELVRNNQRGELLVRPFAHYSLCSISDFRSKKPLPQARHRETFIVAASSNMDELLTSSTPPWRAMFFFV